MRELELVPVLDGACRAGRRVNTVRVTALGDFAPRPQDLESTSPEGQVTLELPDGTRVVTVEGIGAGGVVALGRTAPMDFVGLGRREVPIAYGPPDGLCQTGAMTFARAGHRATRLLTGEVLITGGVGESGEPVTRLERYLPGGDGATPPARFALVDADGLTALDPRAVLGHAVAVLITGEVLVTGGAPAQSGQAFGAAYEGMTRHRSDGVQAGVPVLLGGGPRAFHTATVLPDGRMVLAGGCAELSAGVCAPGRALDTVVIYDPATERFAEGPRLRRARWDHDAILRGDGALVLVGGRGEGGAALPVEVYDPSEGRGFDLGSAAGRGAALPTGAIAVVGGEARLLASGAVLELAAGPARAGHAVTPLEDGALLISGGAPGQPLGVLDVRAGLRAVGGFDRARHTATLLADGTVLLAGGERPGGGASAEAAVFVRSLIGPYASLPVLTLDGTGDPWLPTRPDRAAIADGRLRLSAPQRGDGGRPGELALVAALRVDGMRLEVRAGRAGAGAAALVFGFRSDADYAFLALEPGRPVALYRVRPGRTGQSLVEPTLGCEAQVLDDGELPDGGDGPLTLTTRDGRIELRAAERTVFTCAPEAPPGRGHVGVAALFGTVTFDSLSLER